jgi:hypothetical protein
MQNPVFVNNTGEALMPEIYKAVVNCVKNEAPLPEEITDIFELTILKGHNEDGSNRGILNWA